MTNIDINDIGMWVLRVLLMAGAIVAGIMGNDNVASYCVLGLLVSFA